MSSKYDLVSSHTEMLARRARLGAFGTNPKSICTPDEPYRPFESPVYCASMSFVPSTAPPCWGGSCGSGGGSSGSFGNCTGVGPGRNSPY